MFELFAIYNTRICFLIHSKHIYTLLKLMYYQLSKPHTLINFDSKHTLQ